MADEQDTGEDGQPRTVFMPGQTIPPAPASVPPSAPAAPVAGRTYMPMAPRTDGDRIQVGDVLNHIFEVKRFLARGGMGEVFEGINVSSDERVAIKVMLPALAADPNVQAMFRKEARTLTRLSHPALVQYRVLAQEPQLGVLYIVTEFIDGANLCDVLSTLKPTGADIKLLARRLADGLRVAHSLGAIHRDISPDNVLLEGGRLEAAKVIDFGIAKDLDPSTKTIVGDGFAGKLNYVAPEQLGDFGRDVGPWSDVYSLGLVLLAVAQGRDVDMGATLVDAVDRRRAGPDLTAAPPEIRPVLERMLVPDPAKRLRSMDEVIAALDGAGSGVPSPPPEKSASASPKRPKPAAPAAEAGEAKSRMPLIAGGGVAALLVAAAGGYMLLGHDSAKAPPAAPVEAAASSQPPLERARQAIDAALPGIKCSWLSITRLTDSNGGVALASAGVARDPASAQGAISRALSGAGVQASTIDFEQVVPVEQQLCLALDTLNAVRQVGGSGLSVEQPKFELTRNSAGEMATDAIVTVDIGAAGSGLALYGIEPDGKIDALASSRAEFEKAAADPANRFVKTGASAYRLSLNTSHQGLSGIIMLTARAPFDSALLATPPAQRGADWADRLKQEAAQGGWKAQMIWYRTVDEVPG
jgi:tRNA A-37 threonylcarbamoyl transferase component Bud32